MIEQFKKIKMLNCYFIAFHVSALIQAKFVPLLVCVEIVREEIPSFLVINKAHIIRQLGTNIVILTKAQRLCIQNKTLPYSSHNSDKQG